MKTIRVRQVSASLLVAVGSFGILVPAAFARPDNGGTGKPQPDPSAGRAAYQQSCARCHGLTGKGDGDYGKRFYPRPRNLTSGTFKFRSTASGTPPTDDDLFHTLTYGLSSARMPDWHHVDESVRWQLVSYIKNLSPVFQEQPPQPVPLGNDPGIQRADLKRGKAVYEKLGCAACHGTSGRANGPSSAGLVDDWGHPIRPADLTQGWNYRAGSDPRAVVTRVLTGISGAPMPSYAEAVSPEDAWQLAYYVRSLQEEPHWTMIGHATSVAHALPESPTDPRWAAAERIDVRLRNVVNAAGEMTAPQTVTMLSVRAVYNDNALSLRVSWHDPSENQGDPADALAVVLRPVGVEGDIVSLQTWPLRDTPPLDLCIWSAARSETLEGLATQYEPVLHGAGNTRTLPSRATYHDGEWTLVLTRPLSAGALEGGAQLTSARWSPMAFAVWDGSNPEQRVVSPWIDLAWQKPPIHAASHQAPSVVWVVSGLVGLIALGLVFRKS